MPAKIGDRVGCVVRMDTHSKLAEWLGWGRYMGDLKIDHKAVGYAADTMRKAGLTNPCIMLDNGKTVYGCECKWGTERAIRQLLQGFKVARVDIDHLRRIMRDDHP